MMKKYALLILVLLTLNIGLASAQRTAAPNPYGVHAQQQYLKDQKALAKQRKKQERRKHIKRAPKKKLSKIDRMGGADVNNSFKENSKRQRPLLRRRK